MAKRIAIDTGVARELCYSEPTWFPILVKMAAKGWSFHLTDICIAELIAARERQSISESEWEQAAQRLDQILGDYLPCLPGKRDLFYLCGFEDIDDPNKEHRNEAFLREYSRAIWMALKQPILPQGTGAEITFSVGGKKFKCPVNLGQAATALEKERTKWVDEMTRVPQSNFDYANAVKRSKTEFDTWAKTSGVPMSVRGDIIAHAQAEYERRLASGYNPASSKRRNDGIDFLLHFTFLWPALLVTTDQKVKNFLRGLDSFQAGWTHLPQELANAWQSGNLEEPNWPLPSMSN